MFIVSSQLLMNLILASRPSPRTVTDVRTVVMRSPAQQSSDIVQGSDRLVRLGGGIVHRSQTGRGVAHRGRTGGGAAATGSGGGLCWNVWGLRLPRHYSMALPWGYASKARLR